MAVEPLLDTHTIITDPKLALSTLRWMQQQASPVYLDTETTGFNPRTCRLVAVQLYMEKAGKVAILDWRRLEPFESVLVPELNKLFKNHTAVGHNLKFDLNFLYAIGVHLGPLYDTELAERIIVGMGAQEGALFGLKDVVERRLAIRMSKAERAWFYKPAPLDQRHEDWNRAFPREEAEYMAMDVTALARIKDGQEHTFQAHPKLHDIFVLEMRVLPALAAVERAGIHIEVEGWRAFIAEKAQAAEALRLQVLGELALPILRARLKRYDEERAVVDAWEQMKAAEEQRIKRSWEATKEALRPPWGEYKQEQMAEWRATHPRPNPPKQDATLPNIDSTEQLLTGLQGLGIAIGSTKSQTLEGVDSDLVRLLLKYRKAQKFVTSFGEGLLAKVEEDGRIHPEYRQIGAATGRMACTNPNWQQVPSRGDGKKLRALVTPAPGHSLVVADFSNIELRILADVSQDQTLIEMFESGMDLHEEMAYRLFKLDRSVDVRTATVPGSTWTYREAAKTLNYGLVYGMSPVRLSRMLKVAREEAEAIFESYFEVLPGVRRWLDERKQEGIKQLRVHTRGGRWRKFPAYHPDLGIPQGQWRGRVERQSGNSPIQGESADITKEAVANFHEEADPRVAWMVAVVHDELVTECRTEHAETVARLLEDCMDRAQRKFIKLSDKALPRPVAKVSDHWEH